MAKKTQPGTGKPRNTADIGFEKQIWDAACVLWGHIPASEYRNVIIGLIFLKYISTAFEKKYNQLVLEGDGFENDPDAYLEENVFLYRKLPAGQKSLPPPTNRKSVPSSTTP